ncbi:hypothetical protein TcasGA2_TC034114 [Tribolium castaneum]|uniref:Uncharacterized protein n=1 Tax=Tribolium castaneum TaxID=7070 RepID=A0A139WDL8_TRICA|nr:hypothetical protein TcasGA2_TC034114 [Tribolium castaneum]
MFKIGIVLFLLYLFVHILGQSANTSLNITNGTLTNLIVLPIVPPFPPVIEVNL